MEEALYLKLATVGAWEQRRDKIDGARYCGTSAHFRATTSGKDEKRAGKYVKTR